MQVEGIRDILFSCSLPRSNSGCALLMYPDVVTPCALPAYRSEATATTLVKQAILTLTSVIDVLLSATQPVMAYEAPPEEKPDSLAILLAEFGKAIKPRKPETPSTSAPAELVLPVPPGLLQTRPAGALDPLFVADPWGATAVARKDTARTRKRSQRTKRQRWRNDRRPDNVTTAAAPAKVLSGTDADTSTWTHVSPDPAAHERAELRLQADAAELHHREVTREKAAITLQAWSRGISHRSMERTRCSDEVSLEEVSPPVPAAKEEKRAKRNTNKSARLKKRAASEGPCCTIPVATFPTAGASPVRRPEACEVTRLSRALVLVESELGKEDPEAHKLRRRYAEAIRKRDEGKSPAEVSKGRLATKQKRLEDLDEELCILRAEATAAAAAVQEAERNS